MAGEVEPLASLVGYGVGYLLFQSLGVWFIGTFGYRDACTGFGQHAKRLWRKHALLTSLVAAAVLAVVVVTGDYLAERL